MQWDGLGDGSVVNNIYKAQVFAPSGKIFGPLGTSYVQPVFWVQNCTILVTWAIRQC